MFENNYLDILSILNQKPLAFAKMEGSSSYPLIKGEILFYKVMDGVLVVSDIKGLPSNDDTCNYPIHAYHIHQGDACVGNEIDPFFYAGVHYNPNKCPHPYHLGDLPPLFSVNGHAFLAVLTNRFDIDQVIGKTIIIHSNLDDFTTQPSGGAKEKIACGKIQKYSRFVI